MSLVAAPLAVVLSAPAAHAAPVNLTLLSINDFHGRIDSNTTKLATTIEDIRAAKGDANTLLVSGGDNIGASLFASAFAEDEPTVEVLNALDVGASAAGNHEFDRGFDWLLQNPLDTPPEASDYTPADWAILGDNVYDKTTGNPAMDESYRATVAGLDVCVAGAVTEETPTLVNPDGISNLEFRDPVAEVNRVVAAMEAEAPCDVTVATYHEGAPDGTKTLAENVAASAAFDSIVNETDASVDAIVTGHTHQTYTYDAPIPGDTGTRPVIQTGFYGSNVGQIDLTVDDTTGDVTAYSQANVPRAAAENLGYPRVAAVKTIVDEAIAAADEIGNVKAGEITEDITTAFTGGVYGPDGYQGGTRDDRASESTLGHLVADALRETPIPGQRTPDIGVANPGGLRAELLYAGDTSTSPENTDGVVTFEEANSVLPFVNNISYVDVTGATFKDILEQQWQRDDEGDIPTRPFLALGLSKNVKILVDNEADRAMDGNHVKRVWVDGERLRSGDTYTVSTFSFLAAGGDNFRAFLDGDATDTGKVDRELWIDGFFGNGEAKAADFRRRMIFTDAPRKVRGGEDVSFEIRNLDLTSLGTMANTEVRSILRQPGPNRALGSFPITDHAATVDLRMPRRVERGSNLRLLTDVVRTTFGIPAAPAPRNDSAMQVDREPRRVVVDETRVELTVDVGTEGAPATGRVRVRTGGHEYFDRLDGGRATFELLPYGSTGEKTVRLRYLGNWHTRESLEHLTLRVRKN